MSAMLGNGIVPQAMPHQPHQPQQRTPDLTTLITVGESVLDSSGMLTSVQRANQLRSNPELGKPGELDNIMKYIQAMTLGALLPPPACFKPKYVALQHNRTGRIQRCDV